MPGPSSPPKAGIGVENWQRDQKAVECGLHFMDPGRWQEIERLFHRAQALPSRERAAFLAEACAADEDLRLEVQGLLDESATAARFLDAQALDVAVAGLGETGLRAGSRLGVYQIHERIGAGGMGEVYRARDTRLGRDVAIKILPRAFTTDPDRLARFEREARVLAALNHPNVGAIYGFEETDPDAATGERLRGLVLELVEGDTLAERLRRGALPVTEALALARQIAEALAAAHRKGIVHRDLKPANIKVTPGGTVKVLDFGLAKAGGEPSMADLTHSPTVTVHGTEQGVILGTAAYMSPEQTRGQAVDKRTDVWAFGCVLYELLTGVSPFPGKTVSDTIAKILEREPDWQKLPRSTPARVRALLRRCLQKDPDKRPADLAAVRVDVEAALASPFRVPRAIVESVAWRFSRPATRWVAAGVGPAAAAAIMYSLSDRGAPLPALTNPVQMTNATGVEDYPTWAPDGRTLAYESSETENWDIWMTQIGGGSAVNRTADSPLDDRYPSWSPDGRQIAFWSARDGGGYYLMPALGGTPRQIVPIPGISGWYSSPPAWSPDGSQLACVGYKSSGNRYEVYAQLVSLETSAMRELSLPGQTEARLDLTWSPDGRYIAYVDAASQLAELGQLRVLRLADGTAVSITDGRANIRSPRWSADGRYLYFVSNQLGATDWWRQRVNDAATPMGDAERVTTALDVPNGAFSPAGDRLAYSKGRWVSNVWRVPILKDRPATWSDAEQITYEQAFIEFLGLSRDGRELAFSSDRFGNQDLWRMEIGEKQATQLSVDRAPDWNPVWSPDRTRLAFYSSRSGNREIWTMPAAGGPAVQLTRTDALEAGPVWSPDGRQIAFRSERTGDSEIWVMEADGGNQRQLTHDPAGDYGATWSPDGQWIAFFSNRGGMLRIWRMGADGGAPEPLSGGPGISPVWSPDGSEIFFIGMQERAGDFWALSLQDRRERPITQFRGKRGLVGQQYPATDGTYLYFPWRDDLGDLWVMDVGRP
jgi:eukaryotic-like serine/threonine-protein kinase